MPDIVSRPYSKQGGRNHERIFKKKEIDYSEGETEVKKETPLKIVDLKGNPVSLNARKKNAIYAEAKHLREKIKDSLCTKNECWKPDDHNVNKMIKSEFASSDDVRKYRNMMKVVGAEPNDVSTERLRRRR